MSESPVFADYVVVGAGSAGCVVASRLSEDPQCSVVLLEAGCWDDRPEIHDVTIKSTSALWNAPWSDTLDWGYRTVPQHYLAGRSIPVARGKLIGGCGSVNALMWVRGNPRDYDRWAHLGATDWSFSDVLPYFERCENYLGNPGAWRGIGGPIDVWGHSNLTPVAEAFLAGATQLGYAGCDRDYNGSVQDGFCFPYQANRTKSGQRCSTATGYLHPVLDRPNLAVVTQAQATRLILDRGAVTGIEYLCGRERRSVHTGAGVVMCAGAFETPKLLMLSGIGGERELKRHGVRCRHSAAEVGQNLQDHLFTGVVYRSRLNHPEAELVSEAGLFTRTNTQDPRAAPGLQMTFGTGKFLPPGAAPEQHVGPGFTFGPVLIQPESRGEVRLKSLDPLDNAKVQPRYLAAQADAEVLAEGIELAREIANTSAFDDFRGEELAPGPMASGRSELLRYVAASASTLWHPVGTCRMGNDDGAVVDPSLQVRGVEKLWVADASVMPAIPAGNTHAPVVMIAERAADFIKNTGRIYGSHC